MAPTRWCEIKCADCGRKLLITLDTLRRVADGVTFVLCDPCASIRVIDGWPPYCECEVCSESEAS